MSLLLLSSNTPRNVSLDGDSIVHGGTYTPVNLSGTMLATLLRIPCSIVNVAIGGTGADGCPHAGWDADEPISSTIYYLASGINDINAGTSAAVTAGYVLDAVDEALAAGCRAVVVRTMIAALTADGSFPGVRAAANALIVAGVATRERVYLYDAAADPFFQDPAANYGPNPPDEWWDQPSGDGSVHPGTIGTLRMMTALASIINTQLL